MSKNVCGHHFSIRTIAYCALFAAMSIVLARILGLPVSNDVRISFEAVPIILAGLLFGPVAGGLVGFCADLLGSLMTFGFTPMLCLAPVLVGLCCGFISKWLRKKMTLIRLLFSLFVIFFGAYVFWQSFALTHVFGGERAFWQNYLVRVGMRSIQFSLTAIADGLIVYLLFSRNIFSQLGLWPPRKKEQA